MKPRQRAIRSIYTPSPQCHKQAAHLQGHAVARRHVRTRQLSTFRPCYSTCDEQAMAGPTSPLLKVRS